MPTCSGQGPQAACPMQRRGYSQGPAESPVKKLGMLPLMVWEEEPACSIRVRVHHIEKQCVAEH